jgi:endothelin-converting enzyme/putative endopeptidase
MKTRVLILASLVLLAQFAVAQNSAPVKPAGNEMPVTELPYSPSLDLTSMDKSVDPCTDFYAYSCGGWQKNNPIPSDQSSWSVYGKLTNDNQRFLWGILDDLSKPKAGATRNVSQQKIGDYFGACMDESAVEQKGASPLKPTLDRIATLRDKRALAPLIAQLHLATLNFYYGGMMFGFGSNQDYADSTQVIAFAEAGGLSLPDRDYYTKTDTKSQTIREKYVAHVTKMFELLGDPPQTAAQQAQRILDLETRLAKASLTRVEKRDPYKLFHKMSRAQLQQLTPSFDWSAFLSGMGIPSVQTFNVTEPEYYKALETEINNVALDDWKNYLRWHLVHSKAQYLSSNFVNEDFNFYSRTLRGTPQMRPRWKRCVALVDRQLPEALGQEFVARTFTSDMKRRTLEMTQKIEKAMEQDINTLTWMSPETKQQALAKLHGIVNKIGYPDKWRDYSSLNIVAGDFYGNVDRALTFESSRRMNKIGKPVDHGEWAISPPTVNAYYDAQMNDINFPAGVLQPPLYDAKMDDAPNYGNTGSTIGHELTHGFDDEGRQFDAKGNLKDWWTRQDGEEFTRRAQCVVDQYAGYVVVDDIHINSKLTEGEDVADIGGTILAWMGWKAATVGQKLENRDGFSPEQRFFIGLAQWACENQRPEEQRVRAITDPHSPGKYRINGVVVNIPEFGQAFSCKAGSPMVKSKDKICRVW